MRAPNIESLASFQAPCDRCGKLVCFRYCPKAERLERQTYAKIKRGEIKIRCCICRKFKLRRKFPLAYEQGCCSCTGNPPFPARGPFQ